MGIDLSKVKPAVQIKGLLELEVRDKDGKLIKKHAQPMRSFTANFLRYLASLFSTPIRTTAEAAQNYTSLIQITLPIEVYDTSNTAQTLSIGTCAYGAGSTHDLGLIGLNAGEGVDSYGLIVGQGTTSPTPNDYAMENPYTHGSSANQLSYGATSIEQPSVSGNTVTLRIVRTFSNNYSNTQNVSEIGLIARHVWITGRNLATAVNQDVYFLIARDVLDAPVSVPSGSTLTVRYVISITT